MSRTLARVRDWAFTVPFLASFGVVLLVFDLLQRLARPFGRRPHETVVDGLQVSLMTSLRVCGTRFHVEGSIEALSRRPCLFVANHQSMFDIPILGALLRGHHPKFVSKQELARRWIPSISFNLRHGGNALIDRRNRESAVAAIRRLGEQEVRGRGVSVVIYPEGTRGRAGILGPFKVQGLAALMAAAPEAPVVPVALDGSWRLLVHGLLPVPFGTVVRVFVGEAMERRAGEEVGDVLAAAREQIERALQRWRGPDPEGPAAAAGPDV